MYLSKLKSHIKTGSGEKRIAFPSAPASGFFVAERFAL